MFCTTGQNWTSSRRSSRSRLSQTIRAARRRSRREKLRVRELRAGSNIHARGIPIHAAKPDRPASRFHPRRPGILRSTPLRGRSTPVRSQSAHSSEVRYTSHSSIVVVFWGECSDADSSGQACFLAIREFSDILRAKGVQPAELSAFVADDDAGEYGAWGGEGALDSG